VRLGGKWGRVVLLLRVELLRMLLRLRGLMPRLSKLMLLLLLLLLLLLWLRLGLLLRLRLELMG
jgi:hypothetical protein